MVSSARKTWHCPAFNFPAEIQRRLLQNGILRQTLLAGNARPWLDFFPVVRLVVPGTDAFYLLTQIDPDCPDRARGLYTAAARNQLGYVRLSEIAALRGPSGAPITWDPNFVAT
jgi:hypothetical protein